MAAHAAELTALAIRRDTAETAFVERCLTAVEAHQDALGMQRTEEASSYAALKDRCAKHV